MMKSTIKTFGHFTTAIAIVVAGLLWGLTAEAATMAKTRPATSTTAKAKKSTEGKGAVAATRAKRLAADPDVVAIASELASVAPELMVMLKDTGSAEPEITLVVPESSAYQKFLTDSATLSRYPYIDVTYSDEEMPTYSTEEFIEKAGTVVFKVNKTNIQPANAFIEQLRNEVSALIKDQQLELYRIDLRGAASPEGPVKNNERLAIGRGKVLRDSIASILPSAQGDIIKTTSVTEDYELLVHYMRKANDPDAELVQSLYDKWKDNPETLKKALMAAKHKTLWPRLLKQYYPQLRAARVILYFHMAPDAVTPPEPCKCKGHMVCQCAAKGTPCHCPGSDDNGCPCITKPEPVVYPVEEYVEFVDTIHRRPILAIGTNLVYDLWYMPDFGFAPMWNGRLEWYPYSEKVGFWNHTSLAAAFINPYWHKWDKHKFYQIRDYEVEGRYYAKFDRLTSQRYGWYLGLALDANKFGIGLSDHRGWQGEGLGAQVTGGYVLPISRCKAWKLEFNVGLGIYATKYDPYVYEDPFLNSEGGHGEYNPGTFNPGEDRYHYYYKWYGPSDKFKLRQHLFSWLGPTQIGISLKYDLLWKRQQRRGASFRHTELVERTYIRQHYDSYIPTAGHCAEKGGEQ